MLLTLRSKLEDVQYLSQIMIGEGVEFVMTD